MKKPVAALLLCAAGTLSAAEFPTRPINLMVAYPAGGSTDVGARIVAAIAEKIAGQSIVVVNKAGAGGQVGWTELSRQKPDGYNIGYINLPALNTVILDPDRKAVFKIDSFTPIVNQPEAAILGMSRSRMEPVWQDGQFVPRLMLPLSLSYDHRIVDGADGIRFLRYIVDRLEHPFLLAL